MVVEGEQVVVGDVGGPDDDGTAAHTSVVEYEVLCRRHYMRRMNSAAARAAAVARGVSPTAGACVRVSPVK